MLKLSIFFFLITISETFFGQSYITKNYTVNEGLPHNAIRQIYKDSNGYLWIGTDAGVSKYDGKEFINLSSSDGLAGNMIWSITEDKFQNIWLGSYDGGISKITKDSLFKFSEENGLVNNHVRKIYYSQRFNCILVGTDRGLSVIYKDTIFNFSEKEYGATGHRMQVMDFFEKGNICYIYTYQGNRTFAYNFDSHKLIALERSQRLHQKHPVTSVFITSYQDTIISLWRQGIEVFTEDSFKIHKDIGQVFDYSEDNDKNIWIASWAYNDMHEPGGIFCLKDDSCINYSDSFGIDSRLVFSTLYDVDNEILWVGTVENGLYKIIKSDFFPKYKNNEHIKAVYIDKENKFWISAKNGVFIYDGDILIKHIKNDFFLKYKNKYPKSFPRAHADLSIYRIFEDNFKKIYIAASTGLFKFDYTGEFLWHYYELVEDERAYYAFDKDNNLVRSSWDLFEKFKDENGAFINLWTPEKYECAENGSAIKSDHIGIWLSTSSNGINLIKEDTVYNFNQNNSPLKTNLLTDISIDYMQNVITSTANDKIYIFEIRQDSLKLIHTLGNNTGIVGKAIKKIASNNDDVLYVNTNEGLNIIDLKSLYEENKHSVKFYNEIEGLPNLEINSFAFDTLNQLYVIFENSVMKYVSKAETKPQASNIFLSSFKINFQDTSLVKISSKDSIKLFKHNENTFEFLFDVINFIDSEKDKFRYRLKGFQEIWTDFSNERKVNFMNLKPGLYKLEIQSKNIHTGYLSDIFEVQFKIKKPWWETVIFYISLVFVLIGIIWLIFTIRFRRLNKEKRQQIELNKKIAETEMKALQSQMNPHFVFNAITAIQNYVLGNDIDNANMYLTWFSNLLRQTLNNASEKFISLYEEINYLNNYINLEKLRFNNSFSTEIKVDKSIDPEYVLIPPMLLQPLIENSIKHGLVHKIKNGNIKLSFTKQNDLLLCSVIDNGIGRQASQKNKKQKIHRSKGLEIVKDRIQLLNTSETSYMLNIVDIENKTDTGTHIQLFLPYKLNFS